MSAEPTLAEQLRDDADVFADQGFDASVLRAAADRLEALTAIAHFAEMVAVYEWEPTEPETADFAFDAMRLLRRTLVDVAALAALNPEVTP